MRDGVSLERSVAAAAAEESDVQPAPDGDRKQPSVQAPWHRPVRAHLRLEKNWPLRSVQSVGPKIEMTPYCASRLEICPK